MNVLNRDHTLFSSTLNLPRYAAPVARIICHFFSFTEDMSLSTHLTCCAVTHQTSVNTDTSLKALGLKNNKKRRGEQNQPVLPDTSHRNQLQREGLIEGRKEAGKEEWGVWWRRAWWIECDEGIPERREEDAERSSQEVIYCNHYTWTHWSCTSYTLSASRLCVCKCEDHTSRITHRHSLTECLSVFLSEVTFMREGVCNERWEGGRVEGKQGRIVSLSSLSLSFSVWLSVRTASPFCTCFSVSYVIFFLFYLSLHFTLHPTSINCPWLEVLLQLDWRPAMPNWIDWT